CRCFRPTSPQNRFPKPPRLPQMLVRLAHRSPFAMLSAPSAFAGRGVSSIRYPLASVGESPSLPVRTFLVHSHSSVPTVPATLYGEMPPQGNSFFPIVFTFALRRLYSGAGSTAVRTQMYQIQLEGFAFCA